MGALTKQHAVIERQLTESDCAVWAIKAMCLHLGVSVPPGKLIRKHLNLDGGGASIRSVRDTLEKFGVTAKPVQGAGDSIHEAPLPAIAMVRLENSMLHYIVVLSATKKCVEYLDPALGGYSRVMSAEEFAAIFTGYLVLCERMPNYTAIDLESEPDGTRFVLEAWRHQASAILAMTVGEVFQLFTLLVGILMLRSFFGSSMLGLPNFWFLSGMALCGLIYVWIGRVHQIILANVKSGFMLGLFDYATKLIKNCDAKLSPGARERSKRFVGAISSASSSLTNSIQLPGNTVCLVLFISFLFWIDQYAASFALIISVALPMYGFWQANSARRLQREVSKAKSQNELGLVYLMARQEKDQTILDDLPWNQITYCSAVGAHQKSVANEGSIYAAVGRLNVFAGLLIGGLQHATHGIGHTIAIFLLLGLYSGVVCRWSHRVSTSVDCKHRIRSLLDLLSDYATESIGFPAVASQSASTRGNRVVTQPLLDDGGQS